MFWLYQLILVHATPSVSVCGCMWVGVCVFSVSACVDNNAPLTRK